MRGKGEPLLKKGFSPFPAPPSPFLKLLFFKGEMDVSGPSLKKRRALNFASSSPKTKKAAAHLRAAAFFTFATGGVRISGRTRELLNAEAREESLKRNLEILSFDTTVRRRPDRSRPPQVGAAAHTCTESAARTAPAKTFRALQPPPFQTPVVFGNSPCFPARACRSSFSCEAETGGCGGNYFPACLSCLSCLFCLSCLYRMNCWRSTSFLTSARCSQT